MSISATSKIVPCSITQQHMTLWLMNQRENILMELEDLRTELKNIKKQTTTCPPSE